MAVLKNILDTRKILDDKPFMLFFLNPANHIDFFSVILMSDMDSGSFFLNINPIPIREILTKAFPVSVFHVIEKVCVLTSIVVARLQSSGLRLKHENIASIKTTHATKNIWTDFHEFVTCICHGTIMEGISKHSHDC